MALGAQETKAAEDCIKTSWRTLPTDEKNSSKSRGRIRADSCMQNTVRASRSSGVISGSGFLSEMKMSFTNSSTIIANLDDTF